MRLKLTIFFVIFWQVSFCQTANFTTGDERSISVYEVQDSINQWVTLAQIPKGQSSYVYPVSQGRWYRIRALYDSNATTYAFNTIPQYAIITNSVTITYPIFKPTNLTWTVSNEKNVSYYWIQKTRNGITTQVTKFSAKGNGFYKYWMNKTVYTYTYTITPVFKDLTKGNTITFK